MELLWPWHDYDLSPLGYSILSHQKNRTLRIIFFHFSLTYPFWKMEENQLAKASPQQETFIPWVATKSVPSNTISSPHCHYTMPHFSRSNFAPTDCNKPFVAPNDPTLGREKNYLPPIFLPSIFALLYNIFRKKAFHRWI